MILRLRRPSTIPVYEKIVKPLVAKYKITFINYQVNSRLSLLAWVTFSNVDQDFNRVASEGGAEGVRNTPAASCELFVMLRRKRRSLEKLDQDSGGEEGSRKVSNRKRLAKLMERAVLKVGGKYPYALIYFKKEKEKNQFS